MSPTLIAYGHKHRFRLDFQYLFQHTLQHTGRREVGRVMTEEKVRENKLRRMAERQGLVLVKSRRRDERSIDYGKFMIVDAFTNTVVAGELNTHLALTPDEVEEYLKGEEQ